MTHSLDLGLQEDNSVEYGIRQCQEMANVLHRLINDGKYDFLNNSLNFFPLLYKLEQQEALYEKMVCEVLHLSLKKAFFFKKSFADIFRVRFLTSFMIISLKCLSLLSLFCHFAH